MNWEDFTSAPTPILVALAMNAVGFVIKKSAIGNRWIPIMLMLGGCGLYLGIEGFNVRHLTEGLVIGAGATGFHQALRQIFPEKEPPKPPESGLPVGQLGG